MSPSGFGLGSVTLHSGPAAPTGLTDVIGTAGDQFRDDFTRLCLFLSLSGGAPAGPGADGDVTVVIGTEYGNTAALARLQRDGAAKGRMLSAQVFPNATSSSAAAMVSIALGATGRTMTVNAGPLTPVLALWQALNPLRRGRSATARLLVGDVYAAEATADVAALDPAATCRSGMVHAVLTAGDEFTAAFDFTPGDARPDGREPGERNGAFATAAFLDDVRALAPGGSATLGLRGPDGRRAAVTVTRRSSS